MVAIQACRYRVGGGTAQMRKYLTIEVEQIFQRTYIVEDMVASFDRAEGRAVQFRSLLFQKRYNVEYRTMLQQGV